MADEITLKPGWLALDLAKAAARMHVPTTDAELVTNILKLAGRGNEVPGNDAGTPPLLSRTGEANLLESALAAIPRLVATINAYKSATNLLSRGDLIQKIIAATTARDNALAKNEKAEAEIKRLREVLSKEPNVFMIAYENGDHERLSHGLGKANASFEAACWDLNAAQTSQKHLAEALLAYVEFTKNHGNKFGPLSPEIKKIDALAQATLIATGAVSADPSKALRSPISKMIFEKQQQEIAEERARNPTPDETFLAKMEKMAELAKNSPVSSEIDGDLDISFLEAVPRLIAMIRKAHALFDGYHGEELQIALLQSGALSRLKALQIANATDYEAVKTARNTAVEDIQTLKAALQFYTCGNEPKNCDCEPGKEMKYANFCGYVARTALQNVG